jgi:putative photosynthetic complex assembly protein 2
MPGPLMAVLFAVLTWWFTTGIILYLDSLPPRTFARSMAGATLVTLAAMAGLHAGALDPTATGSYAGFICAVLIWGWLEMSFLMGFITGPRKRGCHEGCRGLPHFLHATGAILYNELMTLAGGILVWALSAQGGNRTGLWTFGVLWTMRLSAKLNLFLGVANSGENLLPPHLQYLKSFFRKRRMNPLFPISVTAGAAGTLMLAQEVMLATADHERVGLTLVASLLALATLEHWFMVLPWDTERMWTWMQASRGRKRKQPPVHSQFKAKAPT